MTKYKEGNLVLLLLIKMLLYWENNVYILIAQYNSIRSEIKIAVLKIEMCLEALLAQKQHMFCTQKVLDLFPGIFNYKIKGWR